MILGLSFGAFTTLHTVISLIAIGAGLIVLIQMLADKISKPLTAVFLATTVLTSVTGFLFPILVILPSHIVGGISLVLLAIAIYALYGKKLAGKWRGIYAGTAVASLYLNIFVLIVQAFLKVPFLAEIAPTQADPPFGIAQGVTLLAFGYLGFKAVKKFRTA